MPLAPKKMINAPSTNPITNPFTKSAGLVTIPLLFLNILLPFKLLAE